MFGYWQYLATKKKSFQVFRLATSNFWTYLWFNHDFVFAIALEMVNILDFTKSVGINSGWHESEAGSYFRRHGSRRNRGSSALAYLFIRLSTLKDRHIINIEEIIYWFQRVFQQWEKYLIKLIYEARHECGSELLIQHPAKLEFYFQGNQYFAAFLIGRGTQITHNLEKKYFFLYNLSMTNWF